MNSDDGKYIYEDILIGHSNEIIFLSYNYDGTILASASEDGIVKIWKTSNNKELKTIKHDS